MRICKGKAGPHEYDGTLYPRECPECKRACRRAAAIRYNRTDKGRAAAARYRKSKKGRAAFRVKDTRYRHSVGGQFTRLLYRSNRMIAYYETKLQEVESGQAN